jgi:hypothetical protein
MPQKKERCERLSVCREVQYRAQDEAGQEVMWVLIELILSDRARDPVELSEIHQRQQHATNDLKGTIHGLADQSDAEEAVNPFVPIARLHYMPTLLIE